MGVIQHHAIVATTYDDERFAKVESWISALSSEWKRELFIVSPATTNGYRTIVLVPDGSKEGWPHSISGDALREAFREQVKDWEWIEVTYGELGTRLIEEEP